jgi:hypothetical protein
MIKKLIKNKKAAFGFTPFISNLLLVIVFAFFILTFIVRFTDYTNPSSPILSDTYGLNGFTSNLSNSMFGYKDTADKISAEMGSANPSPVTFVFLIFEAAFNIPKAVFSIIVTSIVTLSQILFPVLGGSGLGIVLTTTLMIISTILIIRIVLLVIKVIRTGESER